MLILFTLYLLYGNGKSQVPGLEPDQFSTAVSGSGSESYEYAVIIDGGSTGSRVHVYRYRRHPGKMLIDIDFRNEEYQKYKPGLSSFESMDEKNQNSEGQTIAAYVVPLLNFARQHVPAKVREFTPLYMLCTAGMRKVRERSPIVAKYIISKTYEELRKSEFIVKENWVRIIEGKDEGLWGWMTANYLNGLIQRAVALDSPFDAQTKGVLEMGGESLQISFIPSKSQVQHIPNKFLLRVNIAGLEFPIFTHSYMGIGMEAAQSKFDTFLVRSGVEGTTPCYLRGDTRARQSGQGQKWQGSGNFDQCYQSLQTILENDRKCVELQNLVCTPNGIPMPAINPSISFYYIENFYYTADVLQIASVEGKDFLQVLKSKGQQYCNLDRQTAVNQFPHASDDEITKTCFCAAWLAVMLDFGFDLDDYFNFQVTRDINDVGIDWALGFLVEHSQEVREESSTMNTVIVVAIVLFIAFIGFHYWRNGHCFGLSRRFQLLARKGLQGVKYSALNSTEP